MAKDLLVSTPEAPPVPEKTKLRKDLEAIAKHVCVDTGAWGVGPIDKMSDEVLASHCRNRASYVATDVQYYKELRNAMRLIIGTAMSPFGW